MKKEATPEQEGAAAFTLPEVPTKSTVLSVEIKKFSLKHDTQPRVALDPHLVAEYVELIKDRIAKIKADGSNPDEVPFDTLNPFTSLVQVVRTPEGEIIPWDGFHRSAAFKECKVKEIDVEAKDADEKVAVILSLSANAKHGARRSNKDKQNAVKRAFRDEGIATLSNVAIAELCGVSESTVRNLRPAAKTGGTRVSKKGTKIKTGKIGKKGGKTPKAKKPKAGKPGNTEDGKPQTSKAADAKQERLSILVAKIEKAIGGAEGAKARTGILDDSLELSSKDVAFWAELPDKTIKGIAPLVLSHTMKPVKAFDFFVSAPKDSVLEDLQQRAELHGGEWKFDNEKGLKVTVTYDAKK